MELTDNQRMFIRRLSENAQACLEAGSREAANALAEEQQKTLYDGVNGDGKTFFVKIVSVLRILRSNHDLNDLDTDDPIVLALVESDEMKGLSKLAQDLKDLLL